MTTIALFAALVALCCSCFLLGMYFASRGEDATRLYCVQFRLKGSREDWTVINWSVGSHKRAREALKYMLRDRTYRQYEYRVATRWITEWEA